MVLGWTLVDEWDRSPMDRGVVFANGGTLLEILESTDAAATKFDPSLHFYVEVVDLQGLRSRLEAIGHPVTPIQAYSWGHSIFATTDPSGLTLKFFSR
jgi:uncharacterized glyoxalase superfamily protein PhnB